MYHNDITRLRLGLNPRGANTEAVEAVGPLKYELYGTGSINFTNILYRNCTFWCIL